MNKELNYSILLLVIFALVSCNFARTVEISCSQSFLFGRQKNEYTCEPGNGICNGPKAHKVVIIGIDSDPNRIKFDTMNSGFGFNITGQDTTITFLDTFIITQSPICSGFTPITVPPNIALSCRFNGTTMATVTLPNVQSTSKK